MKVPDDPPFRVSYLCRLDIDTYENSMGAVKGAKRVGWLEASHETVTGRWSLPDLFTDAYTRLCMDGSVIHRTVVRGQSPGGGRSLHLTELFEDRS